MLLSALQECPRCALCMGTILWPICELIDSKLAQRSVVADHDLPCATELDVRSVVRLPRSPWGAPCLPLRFQRLCPRLLRSP